MSRPAWVLPLPASLPPDTTNRPHRAFSILFIDLLYSPVFSVSLLRSKMVLLSVSRSHSVYFWAPQWQTD